MVYAWITNETYHWYIAGLFGLCAYISAIPGLIGLDGIKSNNAFICSLIEYDEMYGKYASAANCLLWYVDT